MDERRRVEKLVEDAQLLWEGVKKFRNNDPTKIDARKKLDAARAELAALPKAKPPPKPASPPKAAEPSASSSSSKKAAPIYGERVNPDLKPLRKPQEPKVRVRGDRGRKVDVPQPSEKGIDRFASRDEQVEDVLRRTFKFSKGTYNQKQFFDEAKKRWENEGRSEEFPIKRAEANKFLRLQEPSTASTVAPVRREDPARTLPRRTRRH